MVSFSAVIWVINERSIICMSVRETIYLARKKVSFAFAMTLISFVMLMAVVKLMMAVVTLMTASHYLGPKK